MDLFVVWGIIAFSLVACLVALKRAYATRSASGALRVVGTGCATFVLGVVITAWMLLEALRRVAAIDDPDLKGQVLMRFIDRLSPSGYVAMIVGVLTLCVGAWLRASARTSPE